MPQHRWPLFDRGLGFRPQQSRVHAGDFAEHVPPANTLPQRGRVRDLRRQPAERRRIRANRRAAGERTTTASACSRTRDFFQNDAPKAFARGRRQGLAGTLQDLECESVTTMRDLAAWLKSQKPHATQNFALGPDKFAKMLHATERVDIPLNKLKAAGEADLARNLASLKSACDQYLPGKPLADCVAKVNADKPVGGAVEGARAQLAGLRQFIIDKDLVTIPGTEQAKVDEAPPFNRWNFAYIEIPGPYEKGLPSTYYIAPADPKWPKAEQEAYVPGKAVLLFTSAHEVPVPLRAIPAREPFGLDLRSPVRRLRLRRRLGALLRGDDVRRGLGDSTPETHIGQLSEALLRNVRFISAIGMHTSGMTMADSDTRCSARRHSRMPATRASEARAAPTIRQRFTSTTRSAN